MSKQVQDLSRGGLHKFSVDTNKLGDCLVNLTLLGFYRIYFLSLILNQFLVTDTFNVNTCVHVMYKVKRPVNLAKEKIMFKIHVTLGYSWD